MKRFMSILLVAIMVFVSIPAIAEEETSSDALEYDFKTFRWGDTKETVIAAEGKPAETGTGNDPTIIAYYVNAVGLGMKLLYFFDDNGLFSVMYSLQDTHTNYDLYVRDFEAFKEALVEKYGEPTLDFELWKSNDYKERYANRKGDALFMGYVSYSTAFLLERSTIYMTMSSDNYQIQMLVMYSPSTGIEKPDYSGDV